MSSVLFIRRSVLSRSSDEENYEDIEARDQEEKQEQEQHESMVEDSGNEDNDDIDDDIEKLPDNEEAKKESSQRRQKSYSGKIGTAPQAAAMIYVDENMADSDIAMEISSNELMNVYNRYIKMKIDDNPVTSSSLVLQIQKNVPEQVANESPNEYSTIFPDGHEFDNARTHFKTFMNASYETLAGLKKAWNKVALQLHADKHPGKSEQVTEAYSDSFKKVHSFYMFMKSHFEKKQRAENIQNADASSLSLHKPPSSRAHGRSRSGTSPTSHRAMSPDLSTNPRRPSRSRSRSSSQDDYNSDSGSTSRSRTPISSHKKRILSASSLSTQTFDTTLTSNSTQNISDNQPQRDSGSDDYEGDANARTQRRPHDDSGASPEFSRNLVGNGKEELPQLPLVRTRGHVQGRSARSLSSSESVGGDSNHNNSEADNGGNQTDISSRSVSSYSDDDDKSKNSSRRRLQLLDGAPFSSDEGDTPVDDESVIQIVVSSSLSEQQQQQQHTAPQSTPDEYVSSPLRGRVRGFTGAQGRRERLDGNLTNQKERRKKLTEQKQRSRGKDGTPLDQEQKREQEQALVASSLLTLTEKQPKGTPLSSSNSASSSSSSSIEKTPKTQCKCVTSPASTDLDKHTRHVKCRKPIVNGTEYCRLHQACEHIFVSLVNRKKLPGKCRVINRVIWSKTKI